MFMDVRMCKCIVCMKEKLIKNKEWHQATKPFKKKKKKKKTIKEYVCKGFFTDPFAATQAKRRARADLPMLAVNFRRRGGEGAGSSYRNTLQCRATPLFFTGRKVGFSSGRYTECGLVCSFMF
jgi:hypothetical protein